MGGGRREQQQQHLPQHLPQRRGTAAGAGRLDSECRRERQADLVSNPPPEAERGQSGNPSWVKNTNASNVTLTLSDHQPHISDFFGLAHRPMAHLILEMSGRE